jgi:hypothetical protein
MKHVKKLREIAKEKGSIRVDVAQDMLDSEDGEMYLKDLLNHGCQSGMVSGLIYYTDTKAFYIEHIDEIDELREEMENETGEPLKIGMPSYNWLAWFGYEETARKIANELSIEV